MSDARPSPAPADAADIMSLRLPGCTVAVVTACADALRQRLQAGLPETWTGFAVVKQSTVRTVHAGVLAPGLAVHTKTYRPARWTDRARDALAGARARVEFENLRRVRGLGLPAVEPLAYGVTTDADRRSFLVTRSLPHATPLPRAGWTPSVAAAAGALLRAVHDAGVDAGDLHPGNVLADTGGELHLVDLTNARCGAPLDLGTRARALAFFLLDLDGGPRHPDAAPLLAAYGASELLRDRTARAWRRLAIAALRSSGKRALRACRDTAVERSGDAQVFRHLPAGDLGPRAVAAAAELERHAPVKSGRRGGVWLLDGIVAKRRSRAAARDLFQAAYWLARARVPSPMPLALVLRRDAGIVCSARIAGDDLRQRLLRGDLDAASIRAAARALGDAVGRLHAYGLRNRDMKLENLLLHPTSGEVMMADLDGVRRKAPGDRRGCGADLGRLLASFREVGAPGGVATIASFVHGYNRARKCLGHSRLDRQTRRLTAARASASARRSPSTSSS